VESYILVFVQRYKFDQFFYYPKGSMYYKFDYKLQKSTLITLYEVAGLKKKKRQINGAEYKYKWRATY